MGDKLFLNFGAKLRLSAKKNDEKCLKNVMNGDVSAAKDALQNLKIRKTTSKWILTDVLSKNSETCQLKPKFMFWTFQCLELSIVRVICQLRY